jgi:hypothetical protein
VRVVSEWTCGAGETGLLTMLFCEWRACCAEAAAASEMMWTSCVSCVSGEGMGKVPIMLPRLSWRPFCSAM